MNRRQIITGAAAVVAAPLVKHIPDVNVEILSPVQEMVFVNGEWVTADYAARLQRLYEALWKIERSLVAHDEHDTWGRKITLAEWEAKRGTEPPVIISLKDVTPSDPVSIAA